MRFAAVEDHSHNVSSSSGWDRVPPIDAPMFVKVSFGFGFRPSGSVVCWGAGCGQDRDEPLRAVEGGKLL